MAALTGSMTTNNAHYALVLLAIIFVKGAAAGVIGLNWGRQSAQRLVPSMVVDLMLQNGIREARIYTGQPDIMEAFYGSGIKLNINAFSVTGINTVGKSRRWIRDRIPYFEQANVRRIYVGHLIFKKGLNNTDSIDEALEAMELLQKAIDDTGFGHQVEVNMEHPDNILTHRTRPSDAQFRPEILDQMLRFIQFIKARGSPFIVDIFPIEYVTLNNIDPSFAFPDNKSTHVVRDLDGTLYTNAFEYIYDSFVWALHKAGAPDLEIVVGQVGWPTDGCPGANTPNAERFYKSLLPKVTSNRGTPMRPGKPIDIFVHSLADENRNPASEPYNRHWGLYRSNGIPKYKVDLSGQGRDIYPAMARGIMRMPNRWCVFNRDTTDTDKLKQQLVDACEEADCTSLAPGGSCSQLDFYKNISYAFNMYFQSKFQEEAACDFHGLGQVVTTDPSEGNCVFPVEVVRGQQLNMVAVVAEGGRIQVPNKFCISVFVFVVWHYWMFWDSGVVE